MARVTTDRGVVIVRRKNKQDVAMLPADELASILQTAHLLASPKNAERLFSALRAAKRGQGKRLTLADLKREAGLDEPR